MKTHRNFLFCILPTALVLMAAAPRSAAQQPTAITLPASELFNEAATFNGTVNPNGTETVAWFEWGTVLDKGYGNQTEPQNIGGGATAMPTTVSLGNLVQGTSYHYRQAASNSFGVVRGAGQPCWTPAINFHTPALLTVEPGTFIDQTTIDANPVAISAGDAHSMALRPDGTASVWGSNYGGQLNIPADATNLTAIVAAYQHCLAWRDDGSVVVWGYDKYGQSTVPAYTTNVVEMAGGYWHSLALRGDGSITGWGSNFAGQTTPPAQATNVVAISAAYHHSLALRDDGVVVAWGYNDYGQTNIPASATNVVAIAAGRRHNVALRADGSVVAWGNNDYGQTNVPASATNVVAITTRGDHSLALRADGSVVAWGRNDAGQCNVPAHATNVVAIAAGDSRSLALRMDSSVIRWGHIAYVDNDSMTVLDLPLGVEGAMNTNVLGSYGLDYSTTNALGAVATATRTVEVASLPFVTSEPATGIGADHATLPGTINPQGGRTRAWFEYGLDPSYGQETAPALFASATNTLPFAIDQLNLLPYMTYHYRAAASNGIGRVEEGSDRTFTLSGPTSTPPSLSSLDDLLLPQGGGTSVWFAAEPAGVDVRVACNNPVLLPEGGLALGGSSLGIAPDPSHSGSAQITLTASDGMQAASQTFTLTVVPVDPSQLLHLEPRAVSNGVWRLRMQDGGTAATNYTVEYRPDLSPTSMWSSAANVVDLGDGEYEVDTATGDAGFYRIKGFRMLQCGFGSSETEVEEGAGTAGMVVVFNSIFTGALNYTWIDELGTIFTGTLLVNGTTAVVPAPPSFLGDDSGIGQLEHLELELNEGTGYVPAGGQAGRMTIEENDADWLGVIETDGGPLGFTLTMLQDNGAFNGRIQSEGFGFFPTNALVQLAFAEDSFTAVATNIFLPVFAAAPDLCFTNYLDLRLDAANEPGATNVGPDRVEGKATLVVKTLGQPYRDTAAINQFVLTRPPTAPSTNEVPLHPVP